MSRIIIRIFALVALIGSFLLAWLLLANNTTRPFSLGLDLSGGVHLEYQADVSMIPEDERRDKMESLRSVIERRVNLFGVGEPSVQTETARLGQVERVHRLIVELPGVTDVDEAIAMIGKTPLLEFKAQNPDLSPEEFYAALERETQQILLESIESSNPELESVLGITSDEAFPPAFIPTPLTGAYLEKASLQFTPAEPGQLAGLPQIGLQFDKEGAELFREITRNNIGKVVAIYLDGKPIQTPVVQGEVPGGEAIITGQYTIDEAKEVVELLEGGALPVPITLVSTESIGPSLGAEAAEAGIVAGIIGFAIVALFLILYYRIPGIIAVVALAVYAIVMLTLFKVIPVTLTAAGIAGFVISLGMAVDANILIFERMKEEIAAGKGLQEAARIGFDRAWLSIRDGNISSIISAAILFWFGSSLIKGFALTFGIGVLVSMVTAITMTRWFLFSIAPTQGSNIIRTLFKSGISK